MKARVARARIKVCCEIGGVRGAGHLGSVSWTHALHAWGVFLCKMENLKTFEKFCIRKGSNLFCLITKIPLASGWRMDFTDENKMP